MSSTTRSPRIGIGGPVGSGKTMLCLKLCQRLRERYSMAVVTNDIYCSEDAQFLVQHSALSAERIVGVETGGCPHTAIRDDTTMNEQACRALEAKFADLDLLLVESGGDNLTATFSPELVDAFIYVIDVAEGDRWAGGPEGFFRKPCHDDRVFSAGEKEGWVLELGGSFPEDEDRLGFELVELGEVVVRHGNFKF